MACNNTSHDIKNSLVTAFDKFENTSIGILFGSLALCVIVLLIQRALYNKLCKESALTSLAIKMIPISMVHANPFAEHIIDSIIV